MPEHYEVKRIANYLIDSGILNQTLQGVAFKNKGERIIANSSVNQLTNLFLNNRLLNIAVKGKYTGFEFEFGTVVIHYRFTGIPHIQGRSYEDRLYTIFSLPINYKNDDHCRFTWRFNNLTLDFYDTRCLSKLYIYPNKLFSQTTHYQELATDLSLQSFLTYQDVCKLYGKRRITIKQWLLDQKIIPSGLGNYLACEVLVRANIYPFLPMASLSQSQYQQLLLVFKDVHQLASLHADYTWFILFNKQRCGVCNAKVIKTKYPRFSQTTHYCPTCQHINK